MQSIFETCTKFKKKYLSFRRIFVLITIISGFQYEAKGQLVGIWSGTVSMTIRSESMIGWGETHINTSFTDNKGNGTIKYEAEGKLIAGSGSCHGLGVAELHDVTFEADSTYRIYVIGPECSNGPNPLSNHQNDIEIADEPIPANPKHLKGTRTTERKLDDNGGTATITLTWDLRRLTDVELIVIPANYDNWLPEPGKNEATVGSVMNISLKLQSRTGKPLTTKAKSFELRLLKTSKEPGITINFPLAPKTPSPPDLQFLYQQGADTLEEAQYIKLSCPTGCLSSNVKIGSYDGGGWTVLKAEAILDDGNETRVQGQLLKPGGEIEICIPKRDPKSKIGEAWLKKYNNPGELDDKDTSSRNKNVGDGLTAYEEYRGVISEAEFGKKNPNKFGRLDPLRKELGVRVDKAETHLFLQGIKWFENATSLKVILFNETEIPPYRRFNENANTAHVYDQYVLNLYKGLLRHDGALGSVFTSGTDPDIPAKTYAVVIDIDAITNEYNSLVTKEKPTGLPFTLAEFIANVVAHELGHGVNAWHHGQKPNLLSPMIGDSGPPFTINAYNSNNKNWTLLYPPFIRIFNRKGLQLSLPYTVSGEIGQEGNTESGDLDCIMAYVPFCSWARIIGADGAWIFNEVPMLNVGRKMCASAKGTSINASNIYFGDAVKGDCFSQIKLK